MTKSMDIVNYSQCHPVDSKNNRKTLLSTVSPIVATTTTSSIVHRTPATATITSRDYYYYHQNQQCPTDSYTPSPFDTNYDCLAGNSSKNNNNTNNINTRPSDFYESKMYQELNSFYHQPHHRACAGYNVPYEMRSFGPMATAITASNVQAPPTPLPPPPPPPPLPPMAIPLVYQRPHHEARGNQSSAMRPHIESNYGIATASTSSSSTEAWYQPSAAAAAASAADQMINMLYMNNR